MPVAFSYPGVYVDELPNGVRTIAGVATSITAFVGRAAMGTDEPMSISTFGDFERQFGGLDPVYPLSYAVRDFFQNGGARAVIVRLYKKGVDGVNDTAKITLNKLDLVAASRGSWGNGLRVRIDDKVSADVAERYGLVAADLFNLTVRGGSGALETFLNVTVKESPRRIDRVLLNESALLRVAGTTTLPGDTPPPRHGDPGPGSTIWDDDNASTPVGAAGMAGDSESLDTATYRGSEADKTGIFALEKTDLFNLMCIPPDAREGDTPSEVYSSALDYCTRRRSMLLVDPPAAWDSANHIVTNDNAALTALGLSGDRARNAALFFPRLRQADPLRGGQLDTFASSGAIAGLMARSDTNRGVWKAPAGADAAIVGVQGLSMSLTNEENGQLNPLGVNCLRTFPTIGSVVWGARTMRGADLWADEYKYIPVRRTALYIEESLHRGLQWVAFEPNDEPLWAQIRLDAGVFMHNLLRQGAFQGTSASDAYFVRCDQDTTTQNDINLGLVNLVVGFAPLKPAEFVIIKLQLKAGQIDAVGLVHLGIEEPITAQFASMAAWQEQNDRYLAASLQWLRLRLMHLLPGATFVKPEVLAAEPARKPWFSRDDSAQQMVNASSSGPAASPGADAEIAAAEARAAAARIDPPPALCLLAERLGLSPFERDTLLMCAASEIDPGIATLYAQLQGQPSCGMPSFALALQTLEGPSWEALSPHRPLRYARLVELAGGSATLPLTSTPLRADERIVLYLKGVSVIDERLGALLMPTGDRVHVALAPSQQAVAEAIRGQLQAAGGRAQVPLVQLVGPDDRSRLDVAREVCAALGRQLYQLRAHDLPTTRSELESLVRLWQRERMLLPIALYLDGDDLQGLSGGLAKAYAAFTSRDIGPAFVGVCETSRTMGPALSFDVTKPSAREQCQAWQDALAGTALADQAGQIAPQLASHFDLNLGDISQILLLARASAPELLSLEPLWHACRHVTQSQLDPLAQHLESRATWNDLVLNDETTDLLRQIAAQVRHRFRVHQELGHADRMTRGLGISALFAGESGTGKTMAAEVIANELNLALYRIDLSTVASKYIGETEKNLRRLFDAAEQGGAILYFDEADALFGKRSEVKDAHDRYASIEINYLLQRMEGFSGLAILATSPKGALDSAFKRRMRFIVKFPYPGPAERRRIWERALAPAVPHETLDYERLSRLGLSGGNIHSIVLNAAFMAAAHGGKLTQAMLINAVRAEMRKLDKPINEAELR